MVFLILKIYIVLLGEIRSVYYYYLHIGLLNTWVILTVEVTSSWARTMVIRLLDQLRWHGNLHQPWERADCPRDANSSEKSSMRLLDNHHFKRECSKWLEPVLHLKKRKQASWQEPSSEPIEELCTWKNLSKITLWPKEERHEHCLRPLRKFKYHPRLVQLTPLSSCI